MPTLSLIQLCFYHLVRKQWVHYCWLYNLMIYPFFKKVFIIIIANTKFLNLWLKGAQKYVS